MCTIEVDDILEIRSECVTSFPLPVHLPLKVLVMNQSPSINRRQFLDSAAMSVAATAAASSMGSLAASEPLASEQAALSDASLVGRLYASLKDSQRKNICFPWDHQDSKRCLLRTFVANNWMITKPEINDEFYTGEQRDLIKQVFESIIHPEWHTRFYKQLEDDAGGVWNMNNRSRFLVNPVKGNSKWC